MNRTIVTITGASGVGKSTLEKGLLQYFGGGRIIAHTSRDPRPEESATNYVFCRKWELRFWMYVNIFCKSDYLWVKSAHGHLYAAHARQFYEALNQTGSIAFGCISDNCHQMVADRFEPEGIVCKAIHIKHPDDEELRRRLEKRGEEPTAIKSRLVSSRIFEEQALQNPNLYIVGQGSPEQVLDQVIDVIYSH
ncbi:MAG: Guanylate kinase [Parcubacteria bacterium OLB19]|nr:MAG: Guanylate kinase [Parcubacteria bacterium OLB19]